MKMKHGILLIILILTVSLFSFGCSTPTDDFFDNKGTEEPQEEKETAEPEKTKQPEKTQQPEQTEQLPELPDITSLQDYQEGYELGYEFGYGDGYYGRDGSYTVSKDILSPETMRKMRHDEIFKAGYEDGYEDGYLDGLEASGRQIDDEEENPPAIPDDWL